MVIRAVQMAVWQRQNNGPVILHSDRGSQFRSGDYQRFLKLNTLICSMSAVGHCGDNAACEGFFGVPARSALAALTCYGFRTQRYFVPDISTVPFIQAWPLQIFRESCPQPTSCTLKTPH